MFSLLLVLFCVLVIRPPPLSTRPDTRLPYTSLFRSAGGSPVLRLWREGVHRRQARQGVQSPDCSHSGCRSERRGRPPGRLSIERRRGRDRSCGGPGQTTRVRDRKSVV